MTRAPPVSQVTIGLRVVSRKMEDHVVGYLALGDSPPSRWFANEDEVDASMFDWVQWIQGAFKNSAAISAVNSLFLKCLAYKLVL